MTFTVAYRGADGARREEEVEAAGRAECVARCRERGIAPISVRERSSRTSTGERSSRTSTGCTSTGCTSAGGGVSLYAAAKGAKSAKTPCVILIGNAGADGPALAVYPEEAIGCVNADALKCKSAELTEKRIAKELFRAFGFACGGYSISRTACAMDLVYSLDDLDAMNAMILSPMRFSGINRSAAKLGLPVLRPSTYLMAVRQGWAPPPTNDVQKAIWEKNKDLPRLVPGDPFAGKR